MLLKQLRADKAALEAQLEVSELKVASLEALIEVADQMYSTNLKKAWFKGAEKMKNYYPGLSMQRICEQYGKSRQSYYDWQRRLSSIERGSRDFTSYKSLQKAITEKRCS